MSIAKVPTAILISGDGSNMEQLIKAAMIPNYPARIDLVIANRPKAKGIDIAKSYNINVKIIDHKNYPTRQQFDDELTHSLTRAGIELICNAGFKRLLTEKFVTYWHNRLLNIHPSLLPAFKGLNTHQRALDTDVKITGCTVHYVRYEMDSGPIIAQAAVPISPQDDKKSLAKRVLKAEHQLYPKALELVASKKVTVRNEKTVYLESFSPQAAIFVPNLR